MTNLERAIARSKHSAAIAYVGYGANYYARVENGHIKVRFNGFYDDAPVEYVSNVHNLAWCPQVFTRTGCEILEPEINCALDALKG